MKNPTDKTTILITNPEGPGTVLVIKRAATTKASDEILVELGVGGVFGVDLDAAYTIVLTEKKP